jgi:hypothetical protein
MTVTRGFLITIASSIGFGCVGGSLGYGLGVTVPDYYRVVFRMSPDMPVDPAHVGFGLGLTQGLILGLLVGLAIVAIVAWYNSRMLHHGETQRASVA